MRKLAGAFKLVYRLMHTFKSLFFLSLYVTRHDILCPNAVKRYVGKTRCKSDVIYATALRCAICTSLSVIYLHRLKPKTNEYDQEIPQSYTADQDQARYYNAFYKTTESIPFRTQIVCAKMCVRFSTFCPQCCRTARERFCCLLC